MKYAVITGAAGGLAREIINSVKEDYTVFALDISPSVNEIFNSSASVIPIICDITDKEEVTRAKTEIEAYTRKIDLVINFAGIVILGSVVENSEEALKKILDVNLIGMYNINKIFFENILAAKGRIINVSSEYRKLDAVPFHSFYTLSKHAVEIYSDSLRREISPFGIKVVKIRPGSFKTDMQKGITAQFDRLVQSTGHLEKPLFKMKNIMLKELDKAADKNKIVKKFRKAIYSERPKLAYNIHNSFKMKLLSVLPAKIQDFIFGIYFR